MALPILDLTKNWAFHFGGLSKNQVPLRLEEKEGTISFYIPLAIGRGIQIELLSFNAKEQIVEGKYTVLPSNNKETVIFKILEVGKLLGHPKGSLSRQSWMITAS